MEIKHIIEAVSHASYCEIIQVVLSQNSTGSSWNYFTHISFIGSIESETARKWLTVGGPKSINKDIKVMISKQVLPVETVINVVDNAVKSQKWIFEKENQKDDAWLDGVFAVKPMFVPETDPTGSTISDNTLVPLELSLYGSNFLGNYYIVELFSTKEKLNKMLTNMDREKIQNEMKKAKLQFDLYSLSDRIGNILCKIPVEVIKHRPTKLSPQSGIAGEFYRSESDKRIFNCYYQVMSSNDHMIVDNNVEPFSLSDEHPVFNYSINPNCYRNVITVVDQETGMIYYSAVHDYSYGSDYYTIISPPDYLIPVSSKRNLVIKGKTIEVELDDISGVGKININKEIYETELRQKEWRDKQLLKQGYFYAFEEGDSDKAILFLREVINDKNLLWDLNEVWLIDPYLRSADILKTVVYCSKKNVKVKCLTNIGAINRNKETREIEKSDKDRFVETKTMYAKELENAIPENTDIKMEFRTIRGSHGRAFHDRYLILKYGINKCRVWSLGISINSIGKSHHIVQIVESPSSVTTIVENIWNSADNEECLIYKNY